jgi:poly(3-hydroxybutyrate) depolymerase
MLQRPMITVSETTDRSRRRLLVAVAAASLIFSTMSLAAEPLEVTGFGSNPGNLRMFSQVPPGLPPGAPLVVLLHGCKQRAASFARDSGFLAFAEGRSTILILPTFDWLLRLRSLIASRVHQTMGFLTTPRSLGSRAGCG